jgi:cold shock CspA family protein
MQVALEVSYSNIAETSGADETIRGYVRYLESAYDRVTSCRVRVAQRIGLNDSQPALPAVLLELGVSGASAIVIKHEPFDYKSGVNDAIYQAFEKAEQQLKDLKQIYQTNSRIAAKADLSFLGRVVEIYPLEDYGYLLNKDNKRLYFHRDAIVEGDFDYLKNGDEAHYTEERSTGGPRASKIWIKVRD